MNGGHDLGGMHGLGPVQAEPEAEEPVFHADWERRVFGLTLATGALGRWTLDMSRFARERQHPADYLRHTYYENWLAGLETLLVESGLVDAQELATGTARATQPVAGLRPLRGTDVEGMIAGGSPATRPTAGPPRFAMGERVLASNRHPHGHTREPRYVRGRTGVVVAHHGSHRFPDRSAEGVIEGSHLYSVRFEGAELWGPAAAGTAVCVDLFEDYLEPAVAPPSSPGGR